MDDYSYEKKQAKEEINAVWGFAYGKTYPQTGAGLLQRAEDDPTQVYAEIDSALSYIWKFAEKTNFEHVLEKHAPNPGTASEKFREVVEHAYTDDEELDTDELKNAVEQLFSWYELVLELASMSSEN